MKNYLIKFMIALCTEFFHSQMTEQIDYRLANYYKNI
jgi:hypothetical protein